MSMEEIGIAIAVAGLILNLYIRIRCGLWR